MSTTTTTTTLHFGVILFPAYQLLDAAGPIDYLNSHSKAMLEAFKFPLAAKAPDIHWHYISPTPDLSPVAASSGPLQIPTCTYADAPALDYLLIPGPDPAAPLPAGFPDFMRRKFSEVRGVLTVCTGSIVLAQTGLLDGLRVCSNKFVLKHNPDVRRKEVKWVGDRRWIIDGKVWSAAGVTAGIDLAAEFARVYFDAEIVELAKQVAEYEPNPAQPDPFSKILEGVEL